MQFDADATDVVRVRNLFADVAIGDWVVPSDDHERVEHVVERTSAFVRRASFEGDRFEADTLAANIDVVFLVHALGAPPNQRRLERELVLAFDSGAVPVVVLTKVDTVDTETVAEPARAELAEVALGVPVLLASGRTGEGVEAIRSYATGNRTLAFLGASGVGKSTLLLQLAAARASDGDVLYVSGEESAGQIALRASRIGADPERLLVLAETDVDVVSASAG